MAGQLQCVVVTPERALFDETADFVALPMYDGELGVAPGRAPLIGRLGTGELRTKKAGVTKRYFVDGGFAQVRDNVVTVLTERALKAEEISLEAAQAALHQAQQPALQPGEQAAHEKAQQRARAQLRIAQSARGRRRCDRGRSRDISGLNGFSDQGVGSVGQAIAAQGIEVFAGRHGGARHAGAVLGRRCHDDSDFQ